MILTKNSTVYCFSVNTIFLILFSFIISQETQAKTTETDSSRQKKYTKIISPDSAIVTKPDYHTVLCGSSAVYEIEPLCEVSEIVLWIKKGFYDVDTLTRLSSPPFSCVLDYSEYPDLDQINLQFGYTLITAQNDTVESPPLSHRWIIDRNSKQSAKTYISTQIPSTDSVIKLDGYLQDWAGIEREPAGDNAVFMCVWHSERLFLAVKVIDDNVTSGDGIEIMFDMKQTRSEFAGRDHRIIYFRPEAKSFVWVVSEGPDGPVMEDSIMAVFSEEKEWVSRKTPDGYVIEMLFAFWTLSDLPFPKKKAGLNIAVRDVDNLGEKPDVVTWAGNNQYARHNPSEWGTLIFRQRMPLLKLSFKIMLTILGVLLFVILIITVKRFLRERKEKKSAAAVLSPIVRKLLNNIDQSISDRSFTPEKAAFETGTSLDVLQKKVENETGTSIQRHIILKRIKLARELLKEEGITIKNIASKSGFNDKETFIREFENICGVSPGNYRKYRLEEKIEEESEEV